MKSRRFYPRAPRPPALPLPGPWQVIEEQRRGGGFRIETTKDCPAGESLVVCTLPKTRKADAPAIAALPELRDAARPFRAVARELAQEDLEHVIYQTLDGQHRITLGDLHALALACDQASGQAPEPMPAPQAAGTPRPRNRP